MWDAGQLWATDCGGQCVLPPAVALAGQPAVPRAPPLRRVRHHPTMDRHGRPLRLWVSPKTGLLGVSHRPCLQWVCVWGHCRRGLMINCRRDWVILISWACSTMFKPSLSLLARVWVFTEKKSPQEVVQVRVLSFQIFWALPATWEIGLKQHLTARF